MDKVYIGVKRGEECSGCEKRDREAQRLGNM